MLGYSVFKAYPNIFCFSTTRHGGKSTGNYASLNLSKHVGDMLLAIQQNWNIVLRNMPIVPKCIIEPYQTHEDCVVVIDDVWLELSKEEQQKSLMGVDALITSKREVLLTIATADCVPIIFYDPINDIIGVAHAGWRGTVKKIAQKVITQMKTIYNSNPKDIKVCIGPSISLASFEVGDEVVDCFSNQGFLKENITWFNEKSHKYHIDLWKANQIILESCELLERNINVSGICTYQRHQDFFSARRLGIESGRITTGIMLL